MRRLHSNHNNKLKYIFFYVILIFQILIYLTHMATVAYTIFENKQLAETL